MLILNQSNLEQLLPMTDVIAAVEQGFLEMSRGQAILPERLSMPVPAVESDAQPVLLAMPAFLNLSPMPGPPADNSTPPPSKAPGQPAQAALVGRLLGAKVVTVFPDNSKRNLDVVQAAYLLLDGETGSPLSMMDGRFITGIRTAATSAVATRYMASTGHKRLGIFGAGVQAEFHIQAMAAVLDLDRILISSRTRSRADALAQKASMQFQIPCEVVGADETASSSDLLCTCTGSAIPLFDGELVAPGTHVNAVGAFTPATRELDSATLRRSWLIVDAENAAGRESGEIAIALAEGAIGRDHVRGSLADVVSGRVRGRNTESEITLFKSCGLAIEDLVTANLAYRRAGSMGIGTLVEF
jgi:ornithine cyclodeaminase/alanine dehydrogenase